MGKFSFFLMKRNSLLLQSSKMKNVFLFENHAIYSVLLFYWAEPWFWDGLEVEAEKQSNDLLNLCL